MLLNLFNLPFIKKARMRYASTTGKHPPPASPSPLGRVERWLDWVPIEPGERFTLLDVKGAGCIASIWFTLRSRDRYILRNAILNIYWDGEGNPSVDVPLGDFVGAGYGEYKHHSTLLLGETSGGYYSFIPMPFSESCKIEVINASNEPISSFYAMIGYYVFEEGLDDVKLRFHAKWRRENPTQEGKPYTILEAEGKGFYTGTRLNMQSLRRERGFTYLEGNFEVKVDDEETLSYGSTGTEDYFLSGWYFLHGVYAAMTHGILIKDERRFRTSCFRFHIFDPIPFYRRISVRVHHGEYDEVETDYSSVAYWYQEEPHKEFSKPCREEDRIPRGEFEDSMRAIYGKPSVTYEQHQYIRRMIKRYIEPILE